MPLASFLVAIDLPIPFRGFTAFDDETGIWDGFVNCVSWRAASLSGLWRWLRHWSLGDVSFRRWKWMQNRGMKNAVIRTSSRWIGGYLGTLVDAILWSACVLTSTAAEMENHGSTAVLFKVFVSVQPSTSIIPCFSVLTSSSTSAILSSWFMRRRLLKFVQKRWKWMRCGGISGLCQIAG